MRPDIAQLIDKLNHGGHWRGPAPEGAHPDTLDHVLMREAAVILQAVFDPENQPSQFGTRLIDGPSPPSL